MRTKKMKRMLWRSSSNRRRISRPQIRLKSASARRRGKPEGSAKTYKDIVVGNTARVASVNGRSQGSKFCFILLFLALQNPQPGANNRTGVSATPGLNPPSHESVKLVGYPDFAGRYQVSYRWMLSESQHGEISNRRDQS
ncbi:MAG: hypothetical protein WAU89_21425 [Candidatus Acidiferrales bacterium]